MNKLWIVAAAAVVAAGGVTAAAYTSHASDTLDGIVYWPSYHERQDTVRASLVDPESARFRALFFNEFNGSQYLCGEVNARNRMGGYVGYRRFYAGPVYPVIEDDNDATSHDIALRCFGVSK